MDNKVFENNIQRNHSFLYFFSWLCQFFLCSLPFVIFTVESYISNLFVNFAQSISSFQTVKFKLCSIKI